MPRSCQIGYPRSAGRPRRRDVALPAIGDAQSPVSENTGTVHRSLWRYSPVDAGDSDERKTRVQSMATSAARAMASGDVALIVSAVV